MTDRPEPHLPLTHLSYHVLLALADRPRHETSRSDPVARRIARWASRRDAKSGRRPALARPPLGGRAGIAHAHACGVADPAMSDPLAPHPITASRAHLSARRRAGRRPQCHDHGGGTSLHSVAAHPPGLDLERLPPAAVPARPLDGANRSSRPSRSRVKALNDDFLDLLATLIRVEARFLVVGAHAMAVHGVPRATGDLDLWIERTPENAERVWRALAEFGAPLRPRHLSKRPRAAGDRRTDRSAERLWAMSEEWVRGAGAPPWPEP